MKRFVIVSSSFAVLVFLLLAAGSGFSQPPIDPRLLDAQAAYDEGIRLRNERTFKAYREALTKFQESARLFREAGDVKNSASSLIGVGFMQDMLDDHEAALDTYQRALVVFRQYELKSLEARTLNNIGRIYDDLGDRQKALEYHLQALPARVAAADRNGEAVTLNSIGQVYANIGERQKALEYYNRALVIRRELGGKGEQAITLNNIGVVYDALGAKQLAIIYFDQALILRRAAGDRAGEAITLNNIGLATEALLGPAKAIEYYQRSLDILTSLGLENMKATVLSNLGMAYELSGNLKKALDMNREALVLHRAAESLDGEARTINNIAEIDLQLGNTQQAVAGLNQALVLARASQEKELEAVIYGNLMVASRTTGKTTLAIFYGKQSINKYQELRREIDGLDRETQRIYLRSKEDNYRQLADLLIEAGQFAAAEQVLRMLKEEEYFEFIKRDAAEIKNLAQRVTLSPKEADLLKRYTTIADNVSALGLEFSKLDEKKRRLTRGGEALTTDEQTRYDKLASQVADANSAFKLFLEKQLLEELGRNEVKKIESDRNLQARLGKWGKGTVALYTIVMEDRYRVILTTPTVQIDGKTEIKAADLNKKIFAFREALLNRSVDPRPLGKELYDILIKPVEKDLNAAGATHLLWSLDGALRYIPLAALSPDGKSYMVEKYANAVLTLKTRDDLNEPVNTWRALGVGISDAIAVADPMDAKKSVTFAALPDAKKELLNIVRDETQPAEKGILPGRRFLDKDFTRTSFRDSLAQETADGKRRFNLVHIASHFSLGDDWGSSYLVLGDGNILTLEQISTAPDLSFDDVELVTLSACHTAFTNYSNGREIDSLAEAVQTKSGRAVLATLWAIADVSTAAWMSEFYTQKKNNRSMTKADAIQSAQKAMIEGRVKVTVEAAGKLRSTASLSKDKSNMPAFVFDENKPFAHPYYWSPFVLFGNWR